LVLVTVSGLMLLLGGLSILLGAHVIKGITLLVTFLIPVSFMMHNFWKIEDAQMKIGEMVNFTKNIALLGALFIFLAIPRPWVFRFFL
jgi:putative oxidoreductase